MTESDNPTCRVMMRQEEQLFDECFVMARRIMKRHEPEAWSDDAGGHQYWNSLPLLALEILHTMRSLNNAIRNAPPKELEHIIESQAVILSEMAIIRKNDRKPEE